MTTTTAQPQVSPGDIVKVVNCESFDIPVKWNNRPYTLRAGEPAHIPAACAFLYFGDPRTTEKFQAVVEPDGSRQYVVDRPTEVRRLRIKWGGGLTGDERTFDDCPIPRVEVFTLDNERITTVLEDPEGRSVMPAATTQASDDELRAIIQKQQRQIDALAQAHGLKQETEKAAADEEDLPTDGELPDLTTE